MNSVVRAALTQTKNVAELPSNLNGLNQADVENIRSANVAHNIQLIREAVKRGSMIICLNELFPAPYFATGKEANKSWLQFAESAEKGSTVLELCELTREVAVTVLAPLYEITPRGDRYNTTVVLEGGEVIGKYRKTHIPHGSNGRGSFTEKFYYKRSDDPNQNKGRQKVEGYPLMPVFTTQVGKVGVATCFDRHFPEVWKLLREGGAQIVFSPAVTFGKTSEKAWETEFPTEAIRQELYIGGSNKKGVEFPGGPEYFGRSYFVEPEGGEKLRNISDHPELIISDLDLSRVGSNPSGWNLVENQRFDLAK